MVDFIERGQNLRQYRLVHRAIAKIQIHRFTNRILIFTQKIAQSGQITNAVGIIRHGIFMIRRSLYRQPFDNALLYVCVHVVLLCLNGIEQKASCKIL